MTDYKKMYEEALERAKEMSALPDDRATMEYIFPELKESEDEKIRKAILELVKQSSHILNPINQESMLAWLEKQGEKLPVGFYYVDSNGNKYFSDTFKNGNFTFHVEKCEQILSNSAKTCKDEQKPTDKIEPKCEPKKASRNDYKKIIEHYGVRNQLKKLSEEVYELQEAVIEHDLLCIDDDSYNKRITEEIADVFVILRQLVMHFEIDQYEIENIADYKVKRTLERIEEQKKQKK